MKLNSLSILIPCYNDELTIETAVREAIKVGREVVKNHVEVVVIDDGSSDGSGDVLRKLTEKYGPMMRVYSHPVNQGYGITIRELYYAGRHDWLFTVPGDFQVGAAEIEKLLPHTKELDLIVGWRKYREDPSSRIIQSEIYNFLIRSLFNVNIHDVNSVRLMKRSLLTKIELQAASAFVDTELIIKASTAGFLVGEAVVDHRRDPGKGGGGSLNTIVTTINELIRYKARVQ